MNGTRWLHSNQALIFPSRRIQRRMTNYLEHQTTMYEHINSVFWQLYRFFLLDHYCSPNFVCLLHDTSQSSFLLENLDVHPLGQSVTSMHIFSVTALMRSAPQMLFCVFVEGFLVELSPWKGIGKSTVAGCSGGICIAIAYLWACFLWKLKIEEKLLYC